MSRLQNPVSADLRSDAEALAVFRPRAYKTVLFRDCPFKTEILKASLNENMINGVFTERILAIFNQMKNR